MEALAEEGVISTLSPHSKWGLRLDKAVRLKGKQAFRQGLVELQDEGSQLISLLCDVRPGMTVIDLCAGVGGKTLGLAAAMENKGRLIACDVDARRLGRMDERLKRAGVTCVEACILNDADPVVLNGLRGGADRVLVDAPCSGIGAWRRAPEARWRLSPDKLTGYAATQTKVLSRGATYVAPGGRLIYATCSVLKMENENIVEAFQDRHPNFRLLDGADVWRDVLEADPPIQGPMVRLSPATTKTDGFFVAVFENMAGA